MTHAALARDLLAVLCTGQGLGALAIDLNRTHATHPDWLRHARFHVVWQAASYALLALVEVALALTAGPRQEERFYLAAILAGIPMLGFLLALVGRRMYGGALWDAKGIPPLQINVAGQKLRVELSVVAEITAMLMLVAIVGLFSH
jgi:hypothetical protein